MACEDAIRASRRVIERRYTNILVWGRGQVADPVVDCYHGDRILWVANHALRRVFGNVLRFWEHGKEAEARDGGARGGGRRRL